jgi:hypothetical protein
MDALTAYHGTDWLGVVLTLASLYRLGAGRRDGFLYGAAGNVAWGVFALLAGSLPTFGANGAFLLLNLRGYVRWRGSSAAPGPS